MTFLDTGFLKTDEIFLRQVELDAGDPRRMWGAADSTAAVPHPNKYCFAHVPPISTAVV